VRILVARLLLLSTGCGPGLVFYSPPDISRDEMLARASHVFIGVIRKQQVESWPFFRLRIPGDDPSTAKYWRILRREVRIETVLRGAESRSLVDIYEIFWTGGASGDWNSTQDGERDLFLVRVENGRYHVVRDWWRSIFPVASGSHSRLPLDDSRPFWERIALMNWWMQRSGDAVRITYRFSRGDPGRALSLWRIVKLNRGLVRHPSPGSEYLAVANCLNSAAGGKTSVGRRCPRMIDATLPTAGTPVAR
jgi:hypothetical protein